MTSAPYVEGLCSPSFCKINDIFEQAQADFEAQPTTAVEISAGENRIYEGTRAIDPETRLTMIHNPSPLADQLSEHLAEKPCKLTQTGECEAARYLVERMIRKPL